MNNYSGIGILACVLTASALTPAAEPVPAPAAPRPSLVQQRFDEGAAAIEARDWQKAFDIYSALDEQISAKNPSSKSLPIIRVRKGRAMAGVGRLDEAEPVISAALETLPDGAELAHDRHLAWMTLAEIAEDRFDYSQAVERRRRAAEVTQETFPKLAALLKALPIAIFVDAAGALKDADAAQALLDTNKRFNPEWAGLVRNYRGRTLMNMGQLKAARTELEASIKLLGGLSYGKVNLLDTAARSDAAIAALLDHDPEKARKLLTYAGAPMAADQGFSRAQDMSPPACDLEGLKPEDVAVIEFRIKDDGSVAGVLPIYFSGKPGLAVEFARAVSQWSWNPEQLKKLRPFFRAQARIELRCTNVFKSTQSTDLLLPSVVHWLEEHDVAPSGIAENQPASTRVAALKTELQARQVTAGDKALALLPMLIALSRNPAVSSKEGQAFAQRAYEIAKSNGAKGESLAWFSLQRANRDGRGWQGRIDGRYQRELAQVLSDATVVSEPRAEAAIRTALFDSLNARSRRKEGRRIIEPLASSERLPATDAFRVGARIRLANLDYAEGNVEAARAQFAQSGIEVQQCALVDAKPAQVADRGGAYEYPSEALRWGLAGWTLVEFDISSAGIPLEVRTVTAFPPFVFTKSAQQRVDAFRYQQTYRPGGEKGCVGNQMGVHYKIGR